MPSPHARRRQRSLRLTLSFLLIVAAALIVGAAIALGSVGQLAAAAVLAVVLGAGATRLTYSEVIIGRVEAGRGRAELAQDYLSLGEARAEENDAFQAAMMDRIQRREIAVEELEVALSSAQRRAAEAIRKVRAEAERADVAEHSAQLTAAALDEAEGRAAASMERLTELQQELTGLRAELILTEGELVTTQTDLVLARTDLDSALAELDAALAEVSAWQHSGPIGKTA